jgi:hypothetical protein
MNSTRRFSAAVTRSVAVLVGRASWAAAVSHAHPVRTARRAGRRGAAPVVVVIVAAGLAAAGMPALAQPSRPAATATDSVLIGVSCQSRTDCWAVGNSEASTVTRNQILHFNGTKWSAVEVPSTGGTAVDDTSTLSAVRCTSTTSCWAVGNYDRNDAVLTQALHWNGRKWSEEPTPSPGGTHRGDGSDLFAIACTSASSCWADGDDGHPIGRNDVQLNLMLHWNGKHWSQSRTPDPGGTGAGDVSALEAIGCTSAKSCWGVGDDGQFTTGGGKTDNEVLHWNGKKWITVAVPSPGKADNGRTSSGLNALSCTSARSCWAVGEATGTSGDLNESLHWNGRKWSTVAVPDLSSGADIFNDLTGVSCTADANCWAVGLYENGADLNETLHWNGRKWLTVPVPEAGGTASRSFSELAADFCVAATDCWTVGYAQKSGGPEVNQIVQWAGKKWAVPSAPAVPSVMLESVAALSKGYAWAVGSVIEHWNGRTWSLVPGARTKCAVFLEGVAARSASLAWAVGYCGKAGSHRPIIERWNGHHWSVQPSPVTPASAVSQLNGVTDTSPSSAWAVGAYKSKGRTIPLIERWNGHTWKSQASPEPSPQGVALYGVTALSTTTAWAVGYVLGSSPTEALSLAERWTGHGWHIQPTVSPGDENALVGVTALTGTQAWAAGGYTFGSNLGTLVEHWDGASWQEPSTPDPDLQDALSAIAARSASDVWAVGTQDAVTPRTLIVHWNGSTWNLVPSPSPSPHSDELLGVAVVSGAFAWAVGGQGNKTLIERWNGTAWTVQPSPN